MRLLFYRRDGSLAEVRTIENQTLKSIDCSFLALFQVDSGLAHCPYQGGRIEIEAAS